MGILLNIDISIRNQRTINIALYVMLLVIQQAIVARRTKVKARRKLM